MKRRTLAPFALAAILFGCFAYAAFQAAQPIPAPLSSFVPQGALLSIESPNFSALLQRWTNSAEQKRWLAGEDYAGFSRSRLFGRLADAQNEFATTAGLAPDAQFLAHVAGTQSVFAWYDVGNLEFLYITRMAPGDAEKTPLYQLRSKFQERKSGDTSFYVRTQGPQDQPPQGQPPQAQVEQEQAQPQVQTQRTVAFAIRGDYLLLATSEDLIAGALDLMQHPADRTLQNEPWYASSVAAAGRQPGDLRMALNLARIVPLPYFRSYWVQQNITDLKQYGSALSDLYLDKQSFREERVLLPAHDLNTPPAADLAPVLAYVPADHGVYRAQASPSTAQILDQLEDKLLTRDPAPYRDWRTAPEADLETPNADTASSQESSLEQFIDEPLATPEPRSAALQPLAGLFNSAQPSAMLVFSSGVTPEAAANDPAFAPIHNAVVLSASTNWDPAALQRAVTAALGPTMSVAQQGLAWTPQQTAQANWFELDGPGGLAAAVRGQVCILASDRATLLALVQAAQAAPRTAQIATLIGGFRPAAERPAFVHLTGLLDHSGTSSPGPAPAGNTPPFFSGNMASLANTFSDLASETFTESPSPSGNGLHQTVIYQWR